MKKDVIIKTNILKVIGSGDHKNYFNSVNHFNEILAERTGWSKRTIKNTTDTLFKDNILTFENNVIKCKTLENLPEYNRVPDYFLLTKNNSDKFSHLDAQDWEVLTTIYKEANKIHYIFEYQLDELQKQNSEEQYFFGIKHIQRCLLADRKLDFSYDEIRTSIHKLKFYFGEEFHRIPSKEERLKRIGQWKDIFSWSFSIPGRKSWKEIILNKVENIKDQYSKLKLITEKEKKSLEQIVKKGCDLSILEWSKMKAAVENQNMKLQEGVKSWSQKKSETVLFFEKIIALLKRNLEEGLMLPVQCDLIKRQMRGLSETQLSSFYGELKLIYPS